MQTKGIWWLYRDAPKPPCPGASSTDAFGGRRTLLRKRYSRIQSKVVRGPEPLQDSYVLSPTLKAQRLRGNKRITFFANECMTLRRPDQRTMLNSLQDDKRLKSRYSSKCSSALRRGAVEYGVGRYLPAQLCRKMPAFEISAGGTGPISGSIEPLGRTKA